MGLPDVLIVMLNGPILELRPITGILGIYM
jgi:hypothetical protein